MFKFIIKRLLAALPMLLIMSIVTFAIIQAPPGDYADLIKSQSISFGGLSEADAQRIADQYRAQYGLDDPMVVQYTNWITGILTEADFGYSFQHNKPVSELLGERFPRTLGIALVCHILATLLGAGLGIYAASNQYKLGDQISTILSFIGMTIPRFVLALIMLYWLVFIMNVSAFGNLYSPEYAFAPWSWGKFVDLVKHIWPVVFIAVFGGMAYNLRVMRGNLLDVMQAQYVETARAKGLPRRTVIMKHAVPNALHPLVMYQGMALPYMIQGELEVAIIFAIPTIGPLIVESMNMMDVYVTGSALLLIAFVMVLGNIIADVLLAALDPRVRLGAKA